MEFVEPIKDLKKIEAMKKVLSDNKRNQLLFIFGINSALRISDLLRLNFEDVYEFDKKIKVRDRVKLREKKTDKFKTFPIVENVKKALQDYIKDETDIYPEKPLFYSRKGSKHMTRQHAYRILTEAAEWVEIKENIGTHTLRKTWAYHAYKIGQDLTRIQAALNHSSQAETLRYIGITQEEIDDLYVAVNL